MPVAFCSVSESQWAGRWPNWRIHAGILLLNPFIPFHSFRLLRTQCSLDPSHLNAPWNHLNRTNVALHLDPDPLKSPRKSCINLFIETHPNEMFVRYYL